jgi:hypothetical protein
MMPLSLPRGKRGRVVENCEIKNIKWLDFMKRLQYNKIDAFGAGIGFHTDPGSAKKEGG